MARAKRATNGRVWLERAVVLGGVAPFGMLVGRAFNGGLGPEPIATAMNQLGLLALVLLLLSLGCTPLRLVTGAAWPVAVRRALGLLGFGYAAAHVATYLVIDQRLAIRSILIDVTKRPFTIVGALAFLLLLPLAATSSRAAIQRLGGAKWRRLHRLAYVTASLGVLHFVLRVKKDLTEPLIYGAVLAALLGVRVADALRRRRAAAAALPG